MAAPPDRAVFTQVNGPCKKRFSSNTRTDPKAKGKVYSHNRRQTEIRKANAELERQRIEARNAETAALRSRRRANTERKEEQQKSMTKIITDAKQLKRLKARARHLLVKD